MYSNKKLFSASLTAVSGISYHSCTLPPPPNLVSCTLTGPPTRFHLEEQLRSPGHMTSKGANQQMSSITKPWEGLCGMLHTIFIHSPEVPWVTEAMFWEHHKDATRLLSRLFPSLAACPFIRPSVSQLVHPLPSPSTPHTPHPRMCSSQLSMLPDSNSCCRVR